MAEISIIQQNWAAGELSPKMRSRSELAVYKNGSERIVNFISDINGPARFRNGFYYAQNTRRHQVAWLLPFQFNDSDAYELEFTSNYIRFFRNEAIITLPAVTISGATKASPIVITATSHGYANGDEVIISGVVGMTELNGRSFVVSNKSTHTFELLDSHGTAFSGAAYTAYSSGGVCEKIYEVASPYLIKDIPSLKIGQNADTLYIDSGYYEPRKLVRTGATSWALGTYTRTADPFLDKKLITGISKASPAKVTSAGHGYATGDEIIIENIAGMTEVNGRYYTITKTGTDDFTLDGVDSSGYTTFSGSGIRFG